MGSPKLHTVTIEKLVPGGFGLGRLDSGIVTLVRYALPGEKIRVREETRKKDYLFSSLVDILVPSADRRDPPCPHFGSCGGCDLQHATEEAQLRLKKEILIENLQRAANRLETEKEKIKDPVASPQQFGYRQRLRMQVDGNGRFGFFRPGGHILESVKHCMLAPENLNRMLREVDKTDSFRELARHCSSFEILLNPADSRVIMVLDYERKPRPRDSSLAASIVRNSSLLSSLLIRAEGYPMYNPVKQSFSADLPLLSQTVPIGSMNRELTFTWEAGGFCQVNMDQNREMIRLVLEMATAFPCSRVLDLYCGFGNFSLPMALHGSEVTGIDGQNSAIRSGQRNVRLNRLSNCKFEKNDIAAGVRSLMEAEQTFDTIILDPPRQGAADVLAMIPALDAGQVIYVSCDPATLARDLAILDSNGYRLIKLLPLDMFPQTHHLECIALLQKISF